MAEACRGIYSAVCYFLRYLPRISCAHRLDVALLHSLGHAVTIDLIAPREPKAARPVHPEWAAWIEASAYTHADARRELGLANGTFYRRIAKAPTLIDRLAMRSLYEGLEPYR